MIRLKTLLFEDSENKSESDEKLRVLFVGDSQTAASWSYAKILLRSKLVSGKIVAKNGASTAEVLDMLKDNLTDKYDVVSIMAGGNDGAAKSPNAAIKNFETMFNLVRDSGAKLIIVTNPTKQYTEPGDKYYRKGGYPSNDKIANWLSSQTDAAAVINTQDFNKLDFTTDNVHLDADAHKKIAMDWKSAILSELPTQSKSDESPNVEVKRGDSGAIIQTIQAKLLDLGFDVGIEGKDGKFGPHTEEGVKEFQKSIGASATGKLSKSQIDTLHSKSKVTSRSISASPTKRNTLSLKSLYGSGASVKPVNVSSRNISDANTVINFFTSKGLTPEQAAGIAGNIKIESEFNPTAVGDSGAAFGLAQWRDSRRDRLETWTEKNGYSADSVDGQLEYLWWELNNTEKNALNKLKQETTPSAAAISFAKYFERPSAISSLRPGAAEAFFLAHK